jgi:hypothetical protein
LAVTDAFARSVNVHVFVGSPSLEQAPDQTTDRPFVAWSVVRVPTAKLAEPVVPTATESPAGVEKTLSLRRPEAVRVRRAAPPPLPPQTFATPPPPQVWGAVQVPQVSDPPQPSGIVPQFALWAAQLVGVQEEALKKRAFCFETPAYVAVITSDDKVHVGPVVVLKVACVCPPATVTLAGTCALLVLLEERATTAPPAGAAPVSATVPTAEKPQVPLEGEMTSDDSAGAVAPPGLMVSCALAELLLQGAPAATVTKSCAATALVEIVKDVVCDPWGTVTGPVHAGVPAHPGKVAS